MVNNLVNQLFSMEYSDSEKARSFASEVRDFIDGEVIPVERGLDGGHSLSERKLTELRHKAREYGVYAPQADEAYGGLGMSFRDVLPAFEEAGRSLLGPAAIRVDAPDQGNIATIELLATETQKNRWLQPLVEGEISSGFSMTEPIQGGGSDPKMLQTEARQDGDEWVINGHKWWTTGGVDADLLIVFARTDPDAHPYAGCSLFLVPADTAGVEIVRSIPHLSDSIRGENHAEIKFDDVRIPADNLLGNENDGFKHTQQRLGPARLTHCMRYSGMAERSLDVMKAYVSEREAFGESLSEKQALRFDVAEAETQLHAARCMVRDAARRIDGGDEARIQVSMAKTFTANVVQDVIDTALQYCGGNGIGRDLPIADFYAHVRQFRLVDGADEVHKRVIAREAFDDVDPSELENLTRFGE